jgi:tRNA threonylcarbamoyladenosine biosynthesis protein TsaE
MSGVRKKGPIRLVTEVLSKSAEQTELIGGAIGRLLASPGVVLLRGALGAGKTTLTRGLAGGLGLEDLSDVRSPSYTLVNVYQGRVPIYHLDLYRLEGERDLYSTGFDDFLNVEGVSIVEWGERLLFPIETAVTVDIDYAGENERFLHISYPGGKRELSKEFKDALEEIGVK